MGTDEGFTSGAFIKMLRRVSSDDSISAVLVRVDSPGGDAVASDEMLREVRLLSKKKPIVISFSDTAASGGYYISMTGDPIVSYPNTVTGSVGSGLRQGQSAEPVRQNRRAQRDPCSREQCCHRQRLYASDTGSSSETSRRN